MFHGRYFFSRWHFSILDRKIVSNKRKDIYRLLGWNMRWSLKYWFLWLTKKKRFAGNKFLIEVSEAMEDFRHQFWENQEFQWFSYFHRPFWENLEYQEQSWSRSTFHTDEHGVRRRRLWRWSYRECWSAWSRTWGWGPRRSWGRTSGLRRDRRLMQSFWLISCACCLLIGHMRLVKEG